MSLIKFDRLLEKGTKRYFVNVPYFGFERNEIVFFRIDLFLQTIPLYIYVLNTDRILYVPNTTKY